MSAGPSAPSVETLLRVALELADGAAAVVRAGAEQSYTVDAKSSRTDLVTAVDRHTEQWLSGELATRRPDDAVLGEEGARRGGSSGVRWLLDPIDGTMNFVLGLPQFGVSVAAEVDGVIVAGAVGNPATGETFAAGRGAGAYLHAAGRRRRLTGPRDVTLDRAVVATGFTYDPAERARQAGAVAALMPQIADIRRLGSAALDLCFVAAGRTDAYFEDGLNAWDYAAGALIAAEAGCVVQVGPTTSTPGEPVGVVDGRRVFVAACRPELAGPLTVLLAEAGALPPE